VIWHIWHIFICPTCIIHVLQCVCNTLQRTATHCNTLHHIRHIFYMWPIQRGLFYIRHVFQFNSTVTSVESTTLIFFFPFEKKMSIYTQVRPTQRGLFYIRHVFQFNSAVTSFESTTTICFFSFRKFLSEKKGISVCNLGLYKEDSLTSDMSFNSTLPWLLSSPQVQSAIFFFKKRTYGNTSLSVLEGLFYMSPARKYFSISREKVAFKIVYRNTSLYLSKGLIYMQIESLLHVQESL